MPHKTLMYFDTIGAAVATLVTTMSSWLLILTAQPGDVEELKQLLLPLIGAMIVSIGMVMLNPVPEVRRIVVGRAVFALFLGTLTPQLISLWFTGLTPILSHAVPLLGAGGIAGAFFYVLSLPFCARLYSRSEAIAAAAVQKAEEKFVGTVRDVVQPAVAAAVDGKIMEAVSNASSQSDSAKLMAIGMLQTAAVKAESVLAIAEDKAKHKLD